MPTETCKNF